jgi:hypothetical protein
MRKKKEIQIENNEQKIESEELQSLIEKTVKRHKLVFERLDEL